MVRVRVLLAGLWFAASAAIAGPPGEGHFSVQPQLPYTILGSQDDRFESGVAQAPLTLTSPQGTYGITAQEVPEPAAAASDGTRGLAGLLSGHGRGIQIQADALFLRRLQGPMDQPLVLNTAGAVLLTTSDLDLSTALGPRLTIDLSPDGDRCGEVVYFGMSYRTASATIDGANDLRIPGDLALITHDFFQADQMHVEYSSQLQNVEVNGIYHVLDWSWLAGFRYVYFEDNFDIHARDFNTIGSDYRIGTWNNLFGGQLGARVAHTWGSLDWELTGKVGLFANAAQTSSFVGDFNNQFVVRDDHLAGTRAALVADIVLSATYRLSDVWALRGGYNLMWLDGLALAPDQLDFSSSLNAPASYRVGEVCLHGAHLGLEARW